MTNPTEISARYDLTNRIFNAIARRYDRTNCILSFGFNAMWHKKLIGEVRKVPNGNILDLACGTGTLTKKLARLQSVKITGLDPSANMLSVAKKRLGTKENIVFVKGYAESLPFSEGSFAVVTVSYGIRNFADMDASFRQILKVLEPGGRLFILEFSLKAENPAKYAFQMFYIHRMLPLLGWMSTGEKSAYTYLRDSVESFPRTQEICHRMEQAGYHEVTYKRLTPGVAVLFTGVK